MQELINIKQQDINILKSLSISYLTENSISDIVNNLYKNHIVRPDIILNSHLWALFNNNLTNYKPKYKYNFDKNIYYQVN